MRNVEEASFDAVEGNGIGNYLEPPNVWALSRTEQG